MPDQSYADAFPLMRGGGVFLTIVGAAILLGALRFKARYVLLGAGGLIASIATMVSAAPLAAPYGPPNVFQVSALALAVMLEMAAIVWAGRRFARRDERVRTSILLMIVGAHFLLMAPAFGPPIVLLGGLSMANAVLGLNAPRYRPPAMWFVDGALKAGCGLLMFYGHRLACLLCTPD